MIKWILLGAIFTRLCGLSVGKFRPSTVYCNGDTQLVQQQDKSTDVDVFCHQSVCSSNSFCFLGSCPCHPAYIGDQCEVRLTKSKANPWYTEYCHNLKKNISKAPTFNISTPLHEIGGEYSSRDGSNVETGVSVCGGDLKACAYLCYSHPAYGTAVVPISLWRAAQSKEAELWKSLNFHFLTLSEMASTANDRAAEHWESFNFFLPLLQHNTTLGDVMEIGAGPFTQLKAILHVREELIHTVKHFTIWEPNAANYMKEMTACSYRTGTKLSRWEANQYYPFPVTVQSDGGEALSTETSPHQEKFDTVISINVIEHVQDAFKYLTSLYVSLKRGGLLIFHDRYYEHTSISQGDVYHPIRIKKPVLDHFLSHFHVLFNNCSATYDGRKGEKGYYVIARKL